MHSRCGERGGGQRVCQPGHRLHAGGERRRLGRRAQVCGRCEEAARIGGDRAQGEVRAGPRVSRAVGQGHHQRGRQGRTTGEPARPEWRQRHQTRGQVGWRGGEERRLRFPRRRGGQQVGEQGEAGQAGAEAQGRGQEPEEELLQEVSGLTSCCLRGGTRLLETRQAPVPRRRRGRIFGVHRRSSISTSQPCPQKVPCCTVHTRVGGCARRAGETMLGHLDS
mmetsp:Transcript_27739/g.65523  ORF Transcript_27739/g.65523 Transcript_27739/m.65523 type:complete len:222 (+) Transcript_27739:301-966(+)